MAAAGWRGLHNGFMESHPVLCSWSCTGETYRGGMDAPRASKAAYSPVITQSKDILGRETEL